MSRDGGRTGDIPVGAAWRHSRVAGLVHATLDRLEAAAAASGTGAVLDRVGGLATGSRLHRWLVTRPEPRPVRVDVGDSRTVGPILARVAAPALAVSRSWRHARARRAGAWLVDAVRAGPVRAASAFLLLLAITSIVAATRRPTPVGVGTVLVLAGVALLGLRDDRSWERLRETRPGRVLSAFLGPPAEDE